MTDERTFPNDASSVPAARRYVLGTIGDAGAPVADALALMVSELTANAVRHTGTHFTVTIDRTGDRIRVAVTDSGPGQPVVRTPDPTEPSGRGLQIVEALADEWGIVPAAAGPGKTVWFALDVRESAEAVAQKAGQAGAPHQPAGGASTGASSVAWSGNTPGREPGPNARAARRYAHLRSGYLTVPSVITFGGRLDDRDE